MPRLRHTLLQKLVARLDGENTAGILITGSFARGEGGPFSDVDLYHYVRQMPTQRADPQHLELIDGYLVSLTTTSVEKEHAELGDPCRAIWVIPALRRASILLDREGRLAELIEMAKEITWERLQAQADAFASRNLAGTAEEVYKILDGIQHKIESKTLYAVWGLTRELANALLVQRGVLIPTENVFLDCVQAAAGPNSSWTRHFRLATGLDPLPDGLPTFIRLGREALELYRASAGLLRSVILPRDLLIVEKALAVMDQVGIA